MSTPCYRSNDVSVVIPVHNRIELLRGAIASVLAGIQLPAQIIVIDDGSREDIRGALTEWRGQVSVRRLAKNIGAAAARNHGVEQTDRALIAFLDSDDEWLPNKLEDQLERLNRTGADACHSPVLAHGAGGEKSLRRHYEGNLLKPLLRRGNVVDGGFSSLLVKREAFEAVGGLDPSLRSRQDYDFHLRLAHAGYQYCQCDTVGARFRLSGDDRITRNDRARIAGVLRCYRKHRELFLDDRWSRWPTDLAEAARRLVRLGKYADARKVVRHSWIEIARRGNSKASNYSQLCQATICVWRKRDFQAEGPPRSIIPLRKSRSFALNQSR